MTIALYTAPLTSVLYEQMLGHIAVLSQKPALAVVMVGSHVSSQIYVKNKKKQAEKIGCTCMVHDLPSGCNQQELHAVLDTLATDSRIHGIVLQLPLPKGLEAEQALTHIPAHKDVDGLTEANQAQLYMPTKSTLFPATPLGIMRILEWIDFPLEGSKAVVVGRSRLVGKPTTVLLAKQKAQVTSFCLEHPIKSDVLKEADIIISAAGHPNLIKGKMVKEGVTIIDVGITRVGKKLVGDVAYEEMESHASYITPVPGGVGPMTIVSLMTNLVDASFMQQGMERPQWSIKACDTGL